MALGSDCFKIVFVLIAKVVTLYMQIPILYIGIPSL